MLLYVVLKYLLYLLLRLAPVKPANDFVSLGPKFSVSWRYDVRAPFLGYHAMYLKRQLTNRTLHIHGIDP